MVVLIDDIQINGISIVRDGVGLLTQIRDELAKRCASLLFPSNLNCGFRRPRLRQERQAVAVDRRRTSHGCLGMVMDFNPSGPTHSPRVRADFRLFGLARMSPLETGPMRHFLPPFALLAACTFALAAQLAPGEASEPKGMERMQHWAADHDALLDAKLAGLRAGLELTSDQDIDGRLLKRRFATPPSCTWNR
jgi:hypothetical protein